MRKCHFKNKCEEICVECLKNQIKKYPAIARKVLLDGDKNGNDN